MHLSASSRSSDAMTAAVGSPRAISTANVGPDSTANERSESPELERRPLRHPLQGVVLDPFVALTMATSRRRYGRI